ncbi:hypothetical protein PoB_005824500 [Plakobranchus ocellatus]|uniref:WAP domain-containing protein n=1 Tax=Plakobranchus ocellatus TaxID=259542 RepID=A0AAV4CJH8_9GAST|nr:hypothetical protein PoB_005824500 [Plakobranchus ocellatus]
MEGFGKILVLSVLLIALGHVHGQSDSQCPPNSSAGVCEPVMDPCYTDNDCAKGELCCPESCSNVCKPPIGPGQGSK